MTRKTVFPPLPPGTDETRPDVMKWRIDQMEGHIQAHEERLTKIETDTSSKLVATPFGKLPWPIVLAIVGFVMWAKPELAIKILGL